MKKWNSISVKLRIVVILITIISMLLVGFVARRFMIRIKEKTETLVIDELQNKLTDIVNEKNSVAELTLNRYVNYLDMQVSLLELIYNNPDDYVKHYIPMRSADEPEVYLSQRSYDSKSIDKNIVADEIALYSNLESIWHPMMEKDGGTIATSYVGFESGFMISYDKNASKAEYDDDGEVYFPHRSRTWYQKAKYAKKTIFTDLSQDFFGRGLSLTCAKPFYFNGEFAGVVAMDILIDDLRKSIINIDVEKDYTSDYAFLVNEDGDIIASPFMDKDTSEFENIKNQDSEFYSISDNILSKKEGMEKVNDLYIVYTPIKIANWVLCVYVPSEVILRPVNNIENSIRLVTNIFTCLIIIICIIVYFVVRFMSNHITYPILKLKKDVEFISNGNLDYKATIIGNDEISELAGSFNEMTNSLKKYIEDITTLTADRERIGAELNVATHIQKSMLPSIFPAFPNDKRFDIYATMNPAKEVGGDFYDFFKIDDKHIAIVVADVSGKGVPAALFMVIGKTLIKDHTKYNVNLSDTFYKVNNMLCESNSEDLFITAFEAVINIETGHMKYINAGHELPFIYKNGVWTMENIKPGFVLAGMENMKFAGGELFLNKGDKLFQYTDGVPEATNINNELYGIERLEKTLNKNLNKNMRELLPAIKSDIDKFVGEAPQFDDITMLGFELK